MIIGIPLISLAMHWRVFPLEIMSAHVWRQSQTQSNIMNFAEGDMNILNPERNRTEGGDGIYRREFPIMQWTFAWFYRIFGDHVIISRILCWLIGLTAVLGMFFLAKWTFKNDLAGLVAAWTFNFSPEFFYYTVNPIADNLALAFAIWGAACFFRYFHKPKTNYLIFSAIFLSMATLIKLPFLVFFALPYFHILIQITKKTSPKVWLKSGLLMTIGLIPPLLWYAWVIPQWPKEGLIEGVFSENSSISSVFEILWVHLSSTLPELLLNYAAIPLFVAAWYFLGKEKKWMKESFLLMIIWALGVVSYFLYEINMIGTVHDYYLFPFMPMIFILVGFGGWKMITGKNKYMKYLAILALLVVPVTCGLRMAGRWNPEKPGYNPDLLTYQTELRAAVPDDAQVIAGNDLSQFIVLYMIHKKGWVFDKNTLSEEKLVRAMDAGVEYLYSDSRRTESDPRINQYFEEMLYEGGSVKVFKLTSTK